MKFAFDKIRGFAAQFQDNPALTVDKVNATTQIHAIELIDGLSLRVGNKIKVGNFPEDTIFKFDVWQDPQKKTYHLRALTDEYVKTGVESFDRLNILRFPAEKVIAIWTDRT